MRKPLLQCSRRWARASVCGPTRAHAPRPPSLTMTQLEAATTIHALVNATTPAAAAAEAPAPPPAKRVRTADGGLARRSSNLDGARGGEAAAVGAEHVEVAVKGGDGGGGTALPAGFFDDEAADARARKVPLKPAAEEEWARFEREMAAEEAKSENMVQHDFQDIMVAREREQRTEAEAYRQRVAELRARQAAVAGKQAVAAVVDKQAAASATAPSNAGGAGEADEGAGTSSESEDEGFGWRSKGL